jgi:hypothetical protein
MASSKQLSHPSSCFFFEETLDLYLLDQTMATVRPRVLQRQLAAATLTKPTSHKKAHQAVNLLSSAVLAFGDPVITLTRADPRGATFAHTALRATSCGSDLNVTPRYLDSF